MNESPDHSHPELEARLAAIERRLAGSDPFPQTPLKPMSLQEFLLAKSPQTDVEKTLAIGYYLERFGGLASFNVDDLRDAFSRAREPRPANLNDTVNKNIQKGLIMDAPGRRPE